MRLVSAAAACVLLLSIAFATAGDDAKKETRAKEIRAEIAALKAKIAELQKELFAISPDRAYLESMAVFCKEGRELVAVAKKQPGAIVPSVAAYRAQEDKVLAARKALPGVEKFAKQTALADRVLKLAESSRGFLGKPEFVSSTKLGKFYRDMFLIDAAEQSAILDVLEKSIRADE